MNRLAGIFQKINFLLLISSLFLLCSNLQSQNVFVDAENHYQHGLKLYQENKMDEALNEFTYSVSKNPNHQFARFNKAMIHIRKQQFNQAILDLEELRRISPIFDKVNYYLGFSKFKIVFFSRSAADLMNKICAGSLRSPLSYARTISSGFTSRNSA